MDKDIKSLDEQIENLKKNKKKETTKEADEIISDGDTKKIAEISELNEEEELEENQDTKKFEAIPEDIAKEEEKTEEIEEETIEEQQSKAVEDSTEEREEEVNEEGIEEKENSSNNAILLIAGLLLIIILLVLLLLLGLSKNKDKNVDDTKNEEKSMLQKYGDSITGVLSIYREKRGINLTYEEAQKLIYFDYTVDCAIHEIYDDGSVYLDECVVNGKEGNYSYGTKQIKKEKTIGTSENVTIYVSKSTGIATFEVPSNQKNYDVYSLNIKEEYYTIDFLDAKKSDYVVYDTSAYDYTYRNHIVNYKTGEEILSGYADSVVPIATHDNSHTTYNTRYVVFSKTKDEYHDTWGFYDILKKRIIVEPQFSFPCFSCTCGPILEINNLNHTEVVATKFVDGNYYYGVIDYTTGRIPIPFNFIGIQFSGDYLILTDSSNNLHIYDTLGKEYLKGEYDRIYGMVDGKYILVQDNDNMKMIDLNKKLLYNYGKYSFAHANYYIKSGEEAIFQFTNSQLEHDFDYDTASSCLEFIYDGQSGKGTISTGYCGAIHGNY